MDVQRFMKQMLENRAEGFQPASADAVIYLLISERKISMGGSGKDSGWENSWRSRSSSVQLLSPAV